MHMIAIALICNQANPCDSIQEHTGGKSFVIASIPQFQKNGDVPNRALTVGTPRIS